MKKINLKFLFFVIGILLVGFFASGIYFCVQNVFGAGFMGLGFGLVGMGIACLLADGVLFGQTEPVVQNGTVAVAVTPDEILDVVLTVNRCCISREGRDVSTKADGGSLSVTADGLYLCGLYPTPVHGLWSEMTSYTTEDRTGFRIGGLFLIGKEKTDSVFVISGAPPIQMKAFFQYVNDKIVIQKSEDLGGKNHE